jgi:hypothetical protein
VEVRRLVVPAGKDIAEHKAKGEIVVYCLEGRVAYTAFGKAHHPEAGKLLYLPAGEPPRDFASCQRARKLRRQKSTWSAKKNREEVVSASLPFGR